MKHAHRWLPWSDWGYGDHDTDMQVRNCADPECGYADANYRQHQHTYSGGTDSICLGCGKPE